MNNEVIIICFGDWLLSECQPWGNQWIYLEDGKNYTSAEIFEKFKIYVRSVKQSN